MAGLGVYIGNDPGAVEDYEAWLGKTVDFVAAHTGQASWSDWKSSISWLADQFKDLDATLTWSIPMFANGGNLAAAASGAYDANYVYAAQQLANASLTDDKIYVRFGEEFNGTWMIWSAAGGKEEQFAETYRNMVDAFRSVSSKFVFEWNVNIGDFGVNVEKAYPGDAYVDIVGMDFYYDTTWDSKDPIQAWNYNVSRKYGLQWLETFASAHGKPTAYSEWGVNSETAGPYIERAHAWFESHNVVYQQYWESDAAYTGMLSEARYPDAGLAFQTAFGDSGPHGPELPVTFGLMLSSGQLTYTLPGFSDGDVTGNGLANTVNGNAGANHLQGLGGNDTLNGLGGADVLYGWDGDDTLNGGDGDDSLYGGSGNDWLDGGAGADKMVGGLGNDSYVVNAGGDVVKELYGQGDDVVYASVDYALGRHIETLLLTGTAALNGAGNDDANTILGNSGNNILRGWGGDDYLWGSDGNDTLYGGVGRDTLVGGAGADTFLFVSQWDSTATASDMIVGLENKDIIDLRQIDANTKIAGDQAFHLVSAFTGAAGEAMLTYDRSTDTTFLNLEISGDRTADMTIQIYGSHLDFANWLW